MDDQQRARELEPCPFCGNAVQDDEGCFQSAGFRTGSTAVWSVRCGNPTCNADVSATSADGAIDAWNRRAALRAAPERELYEASRVFYNTVSTIAAAVDLKASLPQSWKLVESTGARLHLALLNQHGVAVVANGPQVVPTPASRAHEVHPEAIDAGLDLGKSGESLLAADALEHAASVSVACDGSATAPEWQPIETAPEGRLVVVGWLDAEDSHYPENYEFDYLEDGIWAKHEDCVEHAHAVAPPGSQMPKEQPPYQWWMDLPAFPADRPQGVKDGR